MLSLPSDTLLLDSTKIKAGMNRVTFECVMPDADTLKLVKDFFVESPEVLLLSELKMESFEQAWGQPQKNASVEHHKITIDKEIFRYGIGSHAPSFMKFQLPRAFDTFYATIGLDDESVGGDGASFIVLGDGQELFRSKRMYSTEKQRISVNVRGVRVLELRLDEGDKHDKDYDHGDWANAWLEADH